MIDDALVFLREQVDAHLKAATTAAEDAELVVFADTTQTDTVVFRSPAVSITLLGVEQDRTFRRSDPYSAIQSDGSSLKTQPAITLNLNVLFVANFENYDQSWHYLSLIIDYFRLHPVFDLQNSPSMSPKLERLKVELINLPVSHLYNVWSAMRSPLKPSILYEVKVVTLNDTAGGTAVPVITSIDKDLSG